MADKNTDSRFLFGHIPFLRIYPFFGQFSPPVFEKFAALRSGPAGGKNRFRDINGPLETAADKYAGPFIESGADHITFHIETANQPLKLIETIHNSGCTAGICLNPETPVDVIKGVGPLCDMVLVMTVRPGFGGQEFMPEAAKKISKVRDVVGPDIRIEVDGGIDPKTAPIVVSYGADTLVAGNAIFAKNDRIGAINAIREAAR